MPKHVGVKAAIIPQRLLIVLALFGVLITTAGCSEGLPENAAAQPVIDPFFHTYYEMLGGEKVLGPSISHLFKYGNRSYQYTVGALLGHDPEAPASQRFFLLPIGVDLSLSEPAVPPPSQPDPNYRSGHLIFDEFVPLYQSLMGADVVGRPITEMHYNPHKKRYEQHFENLGFYRLESDPPETVHLLAYGSSKCGDLCPYQATPEEEVVLPAKIDPLFLPVVTRLGIDFTGWPLKDSYVTPDGFTEQVFGNIALIADPSQPARVTLRPITVRLGLTPDSFENPASSPDFVFSRIQGELGYNVPRAFADYLAYHGSSDAAGPPISRYALHRENVFRQCFLNVCLEEHRRVGYPPLIVPAPLGYAYQDLEVQAVLPTAEQANDLPADVTTQPPVDQPAQASTPAPGEGILLQVWERYPIIGSGQRQEIEIRILQQGQPVSQVEPDLILEMPDGTRKNYYMPPTGQDGQSLVQLDGIGAPNNTLITYQVCIYYPRGETNCASDGFLIGESP